MDKGDLKERDELLSIAEAYIEQNLYKQALHIAESWLTRYPVDADANIIRCHALLKMGELEKVHEILKGVENTVIQLSRIYNRVGDLCMEGGLTQEAIKYYRKFITLNPESPTAKDISEKINTLVYVADGSHNRVQEDHSINIDYVASDFYTLTLSELYISQGHLDMAYDVLSEILKKNPGNQEVVNRLKDVRAMINEGKKKEKSSHSPANEDVIQELTRWLKNIDRLKSYAS
jgi:tetratricopeptide (TPR) repeat protein